MVSRVALLFGGAVVLAGCSGNVSSAPGNGRPVVGDVRPAPSVRVMPHTSLLDQPLTIRVTGLQRRQTASLSLSSTDSFGDTWRSSATYLADSRGAIDLARSVSTGGSYTGIDPMGLLETLAPSAHGDRLYLWDVSTLQQFTVRVQLKTRTAARATFWRAAAARGVSYETDSVADDGFFGQFWMPFSGARRHAAVLEFGGSEGGLDGQLVGALLASHGYPTLDIAYFEEPGLPPELSRIPLEYFAKALTWLHRQPQVDPRHIYTLGASRGSEAALLLGVYYPNLVHGVIATSPSDVALCSYPGCTGPVWTLHGRAIPYTHLFDDPHPADNPGAVIPVERIRGPIFLTCGGADRVWVSCAYARAIMTRLNAHRDHYPHVLYAYPAAGHGVDLLVPYEPESPSYRRQNSDLAGRTPLADDQARAKVWSRLLAFLARSS